MFFNLTQPLALVEPVLSLPEKIILALLFLTAGVLFVVFLGEKIRRIKLGGKDVNRNNRFTERFFRALIGVLFQNKIIKTRPVVGIMHLAIFFGFLAFLLEKMYHFPKAFGVEFPEIIVSFYNLFLGKMLFVVSVTVVGAVLYFMVRRGIVRPKTLTRTPDAWIILSFIGIIMGSFTVPFFTRSLFLINITLWVQNLTILSFLVYIPKSKHLHLLFCPVNEFLKNFDKAQLRTLDLANEETEDFGIGKVKDFSWKDFMDSYTCIQCGRCNDACPAMNTKKSLQPRELVLGIQHALEAADLQVPAVGKVIEEKSVWQCTTCAACETRCPVGIEHPSKIIGLRRYKVQAEAACPHEVQNTFTALERSKNVFNSDAAERAKTLADVGAPLFVKGCEYLLWMGCFANFDQGYRKSFSATVAILKKAGVSFGVLEHEICCADPARRMGNEDLYQTMAKKNIAQLTDLGVVKIISACPHCAVTIGRDYTDLGGAFQMIHHSVFINDLIAAGKIKLKGDGTKPMVFHDPCYLSRYLQTTVEPRTMLASAGFSLVEAPRHGEQSFCCGGGGGLAFLEETEGVRINRERFAELAATGAGSLAVACPYCFTMLKDARADAGANDAIALGDIALFVQQSMC